MQFQTSGPPEAMKRDHINWEEISAALQANPGQWAIVIEAETAAKASARAQYIRNSKSSRFRIESGQFESTSRGKDVWARYLAAPPEDDQEELYPEDAEAL